MYERIVVGTDGSDTASVAVQHAVALARTTGAQLHVVTAWSKAPSLALAGGVPPPVPIDDGAWIAPMHASIADSASDVPMTSHAVDGSPGQALIDVAVAVDADLLVVGNRGMHGLRGKLGSVPNTVAHKAPCAVLVVPTT